MLKAGEEHDALCSAGKSLWLLRGGWIRGGAREEAGVGPGRYGIVEVRDDRSSSLADGEAGGEGWDRGHILELEQ